MHARSADKQSFLVNLSRNSKTSLHSDFTAYSNVLAQAEAALLPALGRPSSVTSLYIVFSETLKSPFIVTLQHKCTETSLPTLQRRS